MISIITGLGFGDEGKGVTTNYLSKTRSKPLVIRYGGGNQVGHTVTTKELQHVHHHTGSGTLAGVPTFYSKYCTVDPIGTINELEALASFTPQNIYDPGCMLVTPLDVLANHKSEKTNKHGSVGVGFGKTVERNERHYRLTVLDIYNEFQFKAKCKQIESYYKEHFDIDAYYKECAQFIHQVNVTKLWSIKNNYSNYIFEGHQGVLLDEQYGIFPHVTRSKTTGYNALKIIREEQLPGKIETYLITRCYHTRHGNGPFFEAPINLQNDQWETNVYNQHQGNFKKAPLDLELVQQAAHYDLFDNPNPRNLVITCCDQLEHSMEIVQQLKSGIEAIDYYINESPYSSLSLVKPLL